MNSFFHLSDKREGLVIRTGRRKRYTFAYIWGVYILAAIFLLLVYVVKHIVAWIVIGAFTAYQLYKLIRKARIEYLYKKEAWDLQRESEKNQIFIITNHRVDSPTQQD